MHRNKTLNQRRNVYLLAIAMSLIALSLACNRPGSKATPTAQPNSMETDVQQTFIAQTVAAAQVNPNPPTQQDAQAPLSDTPIPTDTQTPTLVFSDTPSLTPSITITPSSTVPMVSVSVDTNCRIGPGKVYKLLGALLVGEQTEIIARDPSNQYWYVRNPDKPGEFCWLWGQYATTTGNTGSLPVFTPPPTPTFTPSPTPVPDFTVVYNDVEHCGIWHIDFRITNTGGLVFRSVSTHVTDTVTAETVNYANDQFQEYNACILNLGTLQDDLAHSEVGYTTSNSLNNDPTGHSINAAITLCTLDGLGGTCVTKNITFTP